MAIKVLDYWAGPGARAALGPSGQRLIAGGAWCAKGTYTVSGCREGLSRPRSKPKKKAPTAVQGAKYVFGTPGSCRTLGANPSRKS